VAAVKNADLAAELARLATPDRLGDARATYAVVVAEPDISFSQELLPEIDGGV